MTSNVMWYGKDWNFWKQFHLPYNYTVRSILHLYNMGLIIECIHPPVRLCTELYG
jgi:hypothetical protein